MVTFWSGPIETREQATRITGRIGWTFVVFGVLGELTSFYPRLDIPEAIVLMALFVLPALAVAKTNSLWAARWFYALSLFAVGMSIAAAVYGMNKGDRLASDLFGVAVFWLLPMFAAMRAAKAAKWLRQHKQTVGPEGPDGLVFE